MSRAQSDYDDIQRDRERGAPRRGGDPFGNESLESLILNWDSQQAFNNAATANRGSGGSGIGLPPLPGATTEVAAGVPSATPGLGGLSLPTAGGSGVGIPSWLRTAGRFFDRAAPVLGNAADGRANATVNANAALDSYNRTRLDRANSQDKSILERAKLDLDRRQFALDAPGTRISNSVRGSLLANAQPTTISQGGPLTLGSGNTIRPIQFSSPLSAINSNSRALGDLITQQMLEEQQAGDRFDPLPNVDFPEPERPSDGGWQQDALDLGGLASGLGAAFFGPTANRTRSRTER